MSQRLPMEQYFHECNCGFIYNYLLCAGEEDPITVARLREADDLRAAMGRIVIAVAEADHPYWGKLTRGLMRRLPLSGLRWVLREALKLLRKEGLLPRRPRAAETSATIPPGTIPDSAVEALIEEWLVPAVADRLMERCAAS